METLAWVISILAAFYAGYRYERVLRSIKGLQDALKSKLDKKPIEVMKSNVLDPYDAEIRAKQEHEELMRKLNP